MEAVEIKEKTGRKKGQRKSVTVELHRKIIECGKNATQMSNREIADKVDCDPRTVAAVLDKYRIKKEELEDYKKNRADIMVNVQQRCLNALTDEKIAAASPKDIAIVYGTLYDKERLERGQSTSNVASLTVIAERLEQRDHKM